MGITALAGAVLQCERESRSSNDPYMVAVWKDGLTVGHVPRTIRAYSQASRDPSSRKGQGKSNTLTCPCRMQLCAVECNYCTTLFFVEWIEVSVIFHVNTVGRHV